MSPLRAPLKRLLADVREDDPSLARVQARLARAGRPPMSRQRTRVRLLAAALVTTAALVSAYVLLVAAPQIERTEQTERPDQPRHLADGAALADLSSGARVRVVALDDGTRLVLAPGSALTPVRNDAHHLLLQQRRGRVRYEVAPQGARVFEVAAGSVTVEVVGTIFTIDRDEVRVRVEVERGVVLVRGDLAGERVARLGAGDAIEVSVETAAVGATHERAGASRVAGASRQPTITSTPVSATVVTPAPTPGPAPTAAPTPTTTTAPTSASDAHNARADATLAAELARADSLRRAGDVAGAIAVLERVRAARRAPQSSLAAYTLARLALDRHRSEQAEQAFEDALALGLPTALQGPAWAHLAELRGSRADLDGAREAAQRALALGVPGPDAEVARGWLGQ